MRLLGLEMNGFRGFSTKQTFDLDADAIIVVGANGNGKTSLFDAVLWAITGRVPRLGSDDRLLPSRFSDTGQARVVLRMGRTDGTPDLTVTRVFDGTSTRVSVETKDGVLRGPEAEGRLIQKLWKEAATAQNPSEALATAITRSVYLQQDLVRDFIDSVTPQDRFSAVSELVGAGRVTDLQGAMEKAKKAWTTAINRRVSELDPLRNRLSIMESRLAELSARSSVAQDMLNEAMWGEWWAQIQASGIDASFVSLESREAAGVIDSVIKQIDAGRRAAERNKALLDSLIHELNEISTKSKPELRPLRENVELRKKKIQEAQEKVSSEKARVTEIRRLQAELKEKSEQLQALAVLALKHLGDKCPVCDQVYDFEATRDRLEKTAKGGNISSIAPSAPDALPELLQFLSSEEKELSVAEANLRKADQTVRELDSLQDNIEKRLHDVGIDTKELVEQQKAVIALAVVTSQRIESLLSAQKSGEKFSIQLSRIGDQASINELKREIEVTRSKLKSEDADIKLRMATGDQAQNVIEALREAASLVVAERVTEIESLLSDIYSRIDVHPAFSVVRFLTSMIRGRGQLSAVVSDPLTDVESNSLATVLSSSQMNALAVCIFLSLNLGVSNTPLETAILDDPLQSLDDINLLGLIDLLRRTKDQRQLFVSTHDARFGQLLARKLRPGSSSQRTVIIELDGWSRAGPVVTARDIRSDPVPLRLVEAGSRNG